MTQIKDNPLSSADRSNINAALVRLNQLLPHAEFLESIGIDATEYRARHHKLVQDLEAIKAKYFPGL